MILQGLYEQLSKVLQATTYIGLPAAQSIYISVAVKQPPRPFLVMSLVAAPPAEATLDGVSGLIEGEIQFDAYADDPYQARQISRFVRNYLISTFNAGELPDGTVIQFVDVTLDHDEPYEQGGAASILYRSLLRLKAFYSEGS